MASGPEATGRYLVGIDVGGTFTDLLCYEPATRRLSFGPPPSPAWSTPA